MAYRSTVATVFWTKSVAKAENQSPGRFEDASILVVFRHTVDSLVFHTQYPKGNATMQKGG